MTKFIFKSNASDLQKISQSIETLQKNVLYLTYRMDSCLKMLNTLSADKGLQKQVDEYFEENEPEPPAKADLDWEPMALLPVVKRGLQIAGRIDQKYNINKIFIQKYVPPGYRKTANKIVDIAGTLGGGYGIVRYLESLYADDSPGNAPNGFQQKKIRQFTKTSKSYKTRRRQSVCYPAKYRGKYSVNQYRRYSRSR